MAMRVILFGGSGMVGQGVLRECLRDPQVAQVLSVVRSPGAQTDPKLRELVRPDLFDLQGAEAELQGHDACFFCLGVSSAGMTEAAYRHLTFDLTLSVARTLVPLNPGMTFVYVSGAGTDSSEHGRSMWARVKGATENALLKLPFKGAYLFRPGAIEPLNGIRSKTASYRVFYRALGPLLPLLRAAFPKYVTTTEQMGRAMLRVARDGAPKHVLESADINAL
jgi:uncharacterized protein YbjT (DUF2867 family)